MFKSIIQRIREWRVSFDRRQVRRFGMVIDHHPAGSIVNAVKSRPDCIICLGEGWVCEDHLGKPWGGISGDIQACNCGGAGAPCFECNPQLHCVGKSGRIRNTNAEIKEWPEVIGE